MFAWTSRVMLARESVIERLRKSIARKRHVGLHTLLNQII